LSILLKGILNDCTNFEKHFTQAEASREARAKIIASEGEQKASRALREASEIIGDSPAALQLRYLQVIKMRKTMKFPSSLQFK
jgi:erythrocyte band 7 integral membrane protein